MTQKYYAVRKGHVPGIYTSQKTLREQIKGYSYPEYKMFKSFDAAEKYMGGTSAAEGPAKKKAPKPCNFETKYISEKRPVDPRFQPESLALAISNAASAYVDGSYYPTDDTCSYGIVLLHYDYEMHIRGRVADPYCKTNATSEIQAVMAAVMFCVTRGIGKLIIHYDFEAVQSWLKSGGGELGENYRTFMERAAYAVSVTFHKVPAHVGIYGNELADELARQAQKL